MRRYKVTKMCDNPTFEVREIPSQLVVGAKLTYQDANKLAMLLEAGAGFDGSTPPFFIENTNAQANAEVKQILANKD